MNDPWRVKPREEEPVVGGAGSGHPLDQDLLQEATVYLRVPGVGGLLLSHHGDLHEATNRLLEQLFEHDFREALIEHQFTLTDDGTYVKSPGYVLRANPRVLYNRQATKIEEGHRALLFAVRQAIYNKPQLRETLRQHGITLVVE